MRSFLLALAAVSLATQPVTAGSVTVRDHLGGLWVMQEPADQWLKLHPDQKITINRMPGREVTQVCSSATEKFEPFGCSLVYWDGNCVVYISTDPPKETQDVVERHELAHCNGWPADHPEE